MGIIGNKYFNAKVYKEIIKQSCRNKGRDINIFVSQIQKSLPPMKGLFKLNESDELIREYAEQEEIEINLRNLLSKSNGITNIFNNFVKIKLFFLFF